ncbi:MAG: FixH family protein, partial [Pseudomonadota bacterium]
KFNAELAAARRQHNRGWQSSLNYKNGVIQFALRESNGQPLLLENLMMEYGRPAFEQADRTASLVHVGNGIYRAPIALKAGVWALKITGGPADQLYRRDSRLLVESDGVSGREE